ncbi:MAG TPA: hypothetical protein VG125_30185 [Pirellulales bacterium]|nr:hypothetical protein [Pirellulales bacterium]
MPPSVSAFIREGVTALGAFVCFLIGSLLLNLGALACLVALVAEMFSHGESGWGIACIVLTLCGCGQLLALIYGWTKAGEWDIRLLLLANSLCFLGSLIQGVLWIAKFGLVVGP